MIKLNDEPVQPTKFPDGTSQVWKLNSINRNNEICYLDWEFSHEAELFYLAQIVDLIRVENPVARINLHMDYLPYARQDKPISNNTSFALNTFAKILNSLKFDSVSAYDVHSKEAEYLINKFYNISPWDSVARVTHEVNPEVICFPDKGARDRYHRDLAFLNKIHLFGEKTRDQLTGNIIDYKINGDVTDKSVLIVDDICDGGMTFILLAKELLTKGAGCVNLYASHGIYSKGLKPLREAGIKRIFNKYGEVGELQNQIVVKPL